LKSLNIGLASAWRMATIYKAGAQWRGHEYVQVTKNVTKRERGQERRSDTYRQTDRDTSDTKTER